MGRRGGADGVRASSFSFSGVIDTSSLLAFSALGGSMVTFSYRVVNDSSAMILTMMALATFLRKGAIFLW